MFWPDDQVLADMDWKTADEWEIWYVEAQTFVASLGMPAYFMFSQVFTLGESNFSDFSMLYFTRDEWTLYWIFNTWWCIQHYPYALVHITLFWWAYAIEICMMIFKEFFEEHDGMMNEGKGKGKGKGKKGDWDMDSKKDMDWDDEKM